MTRNEAREHLMQIIYEMDAGKSMNPETAEKLTEERLSGNHKARGRKLLCWIIDHLETVDKMINDNSNSWKTSRMPKVDLAIMRLAIGELHYGEPIPQAVVVNEAINLAKKYSTERSSGYVHGVLGAVIKSDQQKDRGNSDAVHSGD